MHPQLASLQHRLQTPLPGWAAQRTFAAPAFRQYAPPPSPPNARDAAVLILFYEKNAALHTLMIERTTAYEGDKHKGQISYPGGKHETYDENMAATALRETQEEIGIAAQSITLLGALTSLYIPVSNFLVHPFVGWTATPFTLQLQASEVVSVLEVPLSTLRDPATVQVTDLQVSADRFLSEVPYFALQNKIVWGATAMITGELLQLLPS